MTAIKPSCFYSRLMVFSDFFGAINKSTKLVNNYILRRNTWLQVWDLHRKSDKSYGVDRPGCKKYQPIVLRKKSGLRTIA